MLEKWFKKKDKRTDLQKEIDRTAQAMTEIEDQQSEEYTRLQGVLEKLIGSYVKYDGTKPRTEKLSPNTLLVVAAGLVQVLVIIKHEHVGELMTSKAASFIFRGRV